MPGADIEKPRALTQEGAVARAREQHQAVHDALAARRPEPTRSWATIHIAGVEDWLRHAL
jgi:GntR family transcriptional repressor for pyruvate dehydrogenase complex